MRILYVTTISLTMNSFFKPHLEMLVHEGNQVDIACNYKDLALDNLYNELGCVSHQIDFSRFPLSLDNIKAFSQLKKLIENGNYDIVHCHTPNASVITRLVCRKFRKKNGLKVFYTAHGFHFYKGAPKLNWMVYYPIEMFCSHFTDKLITINKEDYALAKKKFKAKEVCYIPGVGIDLSKFENIQVNRAEKRKEIGVPEDCFLLLSVGELNDNKNHQIIIKALAKLNNPNVHYAIAGVGEKKEFLIELSKKLGVSEQVHLLGYRKDVAELNCSADVFCFPSIREGLPVSPMEALALGKTVISAENRGTKDIIEQEKNGFFALHDNVDSFVKPILILLNDKILYKNMCFYAAKSVDRFSIKRVVIKIKKLYSI